MEILLVDQYAELGGGQVVLLELAKRLADVAVVAVCAPGGPFTDRLDEIGIRTVPREELRRVVTTERPGRIVANGARVLPDLGWLRLRRTPARLTYICHSTPGSALRKAVIAGLLSAVHEVIPVAESYPRGNRTVDVAPLGLLREQVLGVSASAFDDWPRVIKAYGRLDPMKGLDVLAGAAKMADLRGVPVEVATRASLEGRDDEYEAKTRLALEDYLVDGERNSSWFHSGDIVVISSREGEAVCLTAQEAMAHGAVVVAPRIADLALFVTEGVSGFGFAAGDSADLARAMERAIRLDARDAAAVSEEAVRRMRTRAEVWYEQVVELLASRPR